MLKYYGILQKLKKERRQVNKKKSVNLKGENILGIVEKAQVIRFGMSQKYSRYIGMKSCFVSYVIVKSPSKPYIIVHLFSIVL